MHIYYLGRHIYNLIRDIVSAILVFLQTLHPYKSRVACVGPVCPCAYYPLKSLSAWACVISSIYVIMSKDLEL